MSRIRGRLGSRVSAVFCVVLRLVRTREAIVRFIERWCDVACRARVGFDAALPRVLAVGSRDLSRRAACLSCGEGRGGSSSLKRGVAEARGAVDDGADCTRRGGEAACEGRRGRFAACP